jgi:hypothetical protein
VATVTAERAPEQAEPAGLKANAILVDALVVGLTSTAPAYSLAAVIVPIGGGAPNGG